MWRGSTSSIPNPVVKFGFFRYHGDHANIPPSRVALLASECHNCADGQFWIFLTAHTCVRMPTAQP
jgi:hypothetical protein